MELLSDIPSRYDIILISNSSWAGDILVMKVGSIQPRFVLIAMAVGMNATALRRPQHWDQ